MSKIETTKVLEILKHNQLSPAVLRAIIEEMNLAIQPAPGDEEKVPAVKKQHVILISDPEGKLPKCDFVGWVIQIPENESPATTLDRIQRGACEFNCTRRGRMLPVKTIGEALESVPAKHFKETEVWVKTKTPVLVLRTDNQLPRL